MRIFAQNEGLLDAHVQNFAYVLQRRIHAAAQVEAVLLPPAVRYGVVHALVMHGAGVCPAEIKSHRLGVAAPARLVADRPDDDARAVFIPLVHPPRAVQVQFFPALVGRYIGKESEVGRVVVLQDRSVRFQIRLLHKIDAVQVAQNGKERMRRVVRRAHRVDIIFAEHLQIPFKVGERFHIPVYRHAVAVDALQLDRRAVEL